MSGYLSSKQLERVRPTVTGIGWATPQQAALYTGMSHQDLCGRLNAGEIPYSKIHAQGKRVRYQDLDEYMLSLREKTNDINALAKKVLKGII